MLNMRLTFAAVAALLMSGSRAVQEAMRAPMRPARVRGTSPSSPWSIPRPGPGWTAAHVKRMAQKRRNVARNRRAHR